MKSAFQQSPESLTALQKLGERVKRLVASNVAISLGLLAFVSWGLYLFNVDGIYWDDWVLVTQPPQQVGKLMLSLGSPLTALLHLILLQFGNGVIGYRVLSFFATVFVGIATYRICLRTMLFSRVDALCVSAVSIVVPVFQSRIALINVPAQMYLVLFMAAWLLALSNYESKNPWKRIFSVLFFFCAVQYQSLQFFFAIPVLHILWLESRGGQWTPRVLIAKAWRWARTHIDFLLLPFAALIFQRLIYAPPPMYAGYNSIGLQGLFDGIWLLTTALQSSFFEPVFRSSPEPLLAAIIFLFIFLLVRVVLSPEQNNGSGASPLLLIGLGAFVFFFAVYPYCAVGKLPDSTDWASRFQILVPPGAALMLCGIVKSLNHVSRSCSLAILLYLLVTFVASDIGFAYAYHVDWIKQAAIIKELPKLDSVRDRAGHAFVFVDDAAGLNPQGRQYRFYELSGFLSKAFGDQSRMGLQLSECGYRRSFAAFTGMMYNIDGYKGGSVAEVIVIKPEAPPESIFVYLGSLFRRAVTSFERPSSEMMPAIISVRVEPIDGVRLPADCHDLKQDLPNSK